MLVFVSKYFLITNRNIEKLKHKILNFFIFISANCHLQKEIVIEQIRHKSLKLTKMKRNDDCGYL